MPCLIVHRNFPIEDAKISELQDRLCSVVESVLHKPKAYIMVMVNDEKPIRFGGSDDPALFVEVKSIGLPGDSPSRLSGEICNAAGELMSVSPDRIYIEFANSPGKMWGWNCGTF